jgi:hypothetical protein
MMLPVWVIGALVGAIFGFAQGKIIVHMVNKSAAKGNGKLMPRFFPIIEAILFGVLGGYLANLWFGGN